MESSEKYPALNDADVQIELLLAVSVHASILVSNAVMLDLVELRKNSWKSAELGDVLYTLVGICCISADDDVRATITPAHVLYMYMLSLVSASSVIILFLDTNHTNSPKLSQDCIINVSCYYPLHCKPYYSAISCGESRLFLDLVCGCYALPRKVGSLSLT